MLLPFLSSPSREQTRSLRCLNSRISKIFLPELPVKLQLINRDDLSVSLARYSLAVVWRHLNNYCISSFSCTGSFYLWQRVWAAFVFIGLAPPTTSWKFTSLPPECKGPLSTWSPWALEHSSLLQKRYSAADQFMQPIIIFHSSLD